MSLDERDGCLLLQLLPRLFLLLRALASREVLITAPSGALREEGWRYGLPALLSERQAAQTMSASQRPQDGNSFIPPRRGDRLRDSLIAAAASFSNFVRSSALALAISSSRLRFSASASEMCFCRPRYAILLFRRLISSRSSLSCSSRLILHHSSEHLVLFLALLGLLRDNLGLSAV